MPDVSRRQFAVYAIAVVLVVLLGGRALRAGTSTSAAASLGTGAALGSGEQDAAEPASGSSGSAGGVEVAEPATPEGATGASGPVVVHVAGAVRHPGVYRLAAGARVADGLDEAGGAREHADLDALNLAAPLEDGQQVLVTRRGARPATAGVPPTAGGAGSGAPAAGTSAAGGAPVAGAQVNINSASAVELEALQGVGPATAAKIIAFREQNGPFAAADDLLQVSGIGPKTLEGMRAQVQV